MPEQVRRCILEEGLKDEPQAVALQHAVEALLVLPAYGLLTVSEAHSLLLRLPDFEKKHGLEVTATSKDFDCYLVRRAPSVAVEHTY